MSFDLKNNNYLLSLIAGIVGTLVYLVIDKILEKEDNKKNKIDYINYIKVFIIITTTVLCVLVYSRSDKKTSVSEINAEATGITSEVVNSGLQEVNINQNIHTGNPKF